jgi:hypothetical protein
MTRIKNEQRRRRSAGVPFGFAQGGFSTALLTMRPGAPIRMRSGSVEMTILMIEKKPFRKNDFSESMDLDLEFG